MSMGLKTHHFPRLTDYDEARWYWERADPWTRSNPDAASKPLGTKNQKSSALVKYHDRMVATYHDFPLVTWHDDGTIEVRPYASKNSNAFVNGVLPQVHAWFEPHGVLGVRTRAAVARETADSGVRYEYTNPSNGWLLRPTTGHHGTVYTVIGEHPPFTTTRIDRTQAARVWRETGAGAFIKWLRAALFLSGGFDRVDTEYTALRAIQQDPETWQAMLHDQTQWLALGQRLCDAWAPLSTSYRAQVPAPEQRLAAIERQLRKALYAYDGDVIVETQVPSLFRTSEVRRACT